MDACKICLNETNNRLHTAREMMFGLRDAFTYLECSGCGCVQLLRIPEDMSKYYPKNYYSYSVHGRAMTFLRHQWSAYAYGRPNPIGWLLTKLTFEHQPMQAIRRANPPKDARMLDVGCGSGHLILDLWHLGFRNVAGVDPYIEREIVYESGVTIHKKELQNLPGTYDVIMLHSSFEHMPQPADVMRHLSRLLAPKGKILLRIPVADSYAWRHYGVNWIQLDAPRHFFLHTRKSIEIIANKAGLKISEVTQEGTEGQFLGSEQYLKDIPLSDPRSYSASRLRALLSWRQIRDYRAKAAELNQKQDGDSVCMCLLKAG